MNETVFDSSVVEKQPFRASRVYLSPQLADADDAILLQQPNNTGAGFTAKEGLIEKATAQVAAQAIRVEAEDLTLTGYRVADFARQGVSGDRLISLNKTGQDSGTAAGEFEGPAGVYDVVVGYYDESDGISNASVAIAGQTERFKFDQELGGVGVGPKTAVDKLTHKGVALKPGDRFELKATAKDGEYARFDYVEFVPGKAEDPDAPATPDTPPVTDIPETQTIRVEAEDLRLNGYKTADFPNQGVSGDRLISLEEVEGRSGRAFGRFEGPAGSYNVSVGYYDEPSGVSNATVAVAGQRERFKLDQELDGDGVGPDTAVNKLTHEDVSLKAGDRFKIRAKAKDGDFARFDYVEFTPVDAAETPATPTTPDVPPVTEEPVPSEPTTPGVPPVTEEPVPAEPATPDAPPVSEVPPIGGENADSTLTPLYTNTTKLPVGDNDFSFVSNAEKVAYVSDDTPSMIHFQMAQQQGYFKENRQKFNEANGIKAPVPDPDTLPDPILELLLPEGIEVQGAIRNLSVETVDEARTVEGTTFNKLWRIEPANAGARTDKFTLTWKADGSQKWTEGQELKGFFRGKAVEGDGAQTYQPLDIEVVDVPPVEASFDDIPVWLSVPSDLTFNWPKSDTNAFSRIGINEMELWSYLWDGKIGGKTAKENQDNEGGWMEDSRERLEASGIKTVVPWMRDEWWRDATDPKMVGENIAKDSTSKLENGDLSLLDGKGSRNNKFSLRLTYNDEGADGKRGEYFEEWIKQGKDQIDRGYYLHGFDPEMYRDGESLGFDPRTLDAFKTYYAEKTDAAYVDPKTFDDAPGANPEAESLWAEFKAYRYTKFFKDYRDEMEAYMDRKGIDRTQTPFEMRALTTYHRQWDGLYGYEDYKDSPVYTRTLEDPKMLAEVFDYISPMVYPEIYSNGEVANGDGYDMKLPYKDTLVLDQLVSDSSLDTEVTPIYSAGYPFVKGFDADNSADMLKANILEGVIAGGHGFGIWGETNIDALDMKAISESVSMLEPYEELMLTGKPADGVSVARGEAFVHRLEGKLKGKTGSLVLVSNYSDSTKSVTVKVNGSASDVVVDLENPDAKLSQSNSGGAIEFKTELSNERGRARMFYVGAA